ncbi:hypothetical protein P7C70_g9640, partial [Phenoliferia sp. Uapishka_3]
MSGASQPPNDEDVWKAPSDPIPDTLDDFHAYDKLIKWCIERLAPTEALASPESFLWSWHSPSFTAHDVRIYEALPIFESTRPTVRASLRELSLRVSELDIPLPRSLAEFRTLSFDMCLSTLEPEHFNAEGQMSNEVWDFLEQEWNQEYPFLTIQSWNEFRPSDWITFFLFWMRTHSVLRPLEQDTTGARVLYLCFVEGPFPPAWTDEIPHLFPESGF